LFSRVISRVRRFVRVIVRVRELPLALAPRPAGLLLCLIVRVLLFLGGDLLVVPVGRIRTLHSLHRNHGSRRDEGAVALGAVHLRAHLQVTHVYHIAVRCRHIGPPYRHCRPPYTLNFNYLVIIFKLGIFRYAFIVA
jgi:hypothetical protein